MHEDAPIKDDPPHSAKFSEKAIILGHAKPYLTAGDFTTSSEWRRAMLLAPLGTNPDDPLLVRWKQYSASYSSEI